MNNIHNYITKTDEKLTIKYSKLCKMLITYYDMCYRYILVNYKYHKRKLM